jgi:UrcA family protein
MKPTTLIATIVVLSGSILSAAQAATPSDLPAIVVKFGDLDTTSSAGQQDLFRRLSKAVRTICAPLQAAPGSIAVGMSRYNACVDRAVSDAVARINRPEFTDYVASRMQKSDRVGIQLAAR